MELAEAKQFVDQSVLLSWTDRKGGVISDSVHVFEVNFVPFYGPCLITSAGEIRLDRIVHCALAASAKAA
jgi:hypothetical protein